MQDEDERFNYVVKRIIIPYMLWQSVGLILVLCGLYGWAIGWGLLGVICLFLSK